MTLVDMIARNLRRSVYDIEEILARGPERYRVYEIDKRNGGKRIIAQPASELKAIQRVLIEFLMPQLRVSEYATAYRSGMSIKENARRHLVSDIIVKNDFSSFFNSIIWKDFDFLCEYNELNLSKGDRITCLRALFWRPARQRSLCLAMGSPASPAISNAVMHAIDVDVGKYALAHNVTYSRYADDITISSRDSKSALEVEWYLREIVKSTNRPSLKFNEKKRGMFNRSQKRMVSGLVLTPDGKISLGRERKRKISAAIHHFKFGQLNDYEIEQMRGWIAFARDVEPEFMDAMTIKYGVELIEIIFKKRFETFGADEVRRGVPLI
ncbi:MAG: retron St85 family RNA-directed DNA polymerase [Mesorhizobium sp.]|nr:retron St85 family RNA-directed DNA polymerase [Mesorhizobium sp.]